MSALGWITRSDEHYTNTAMPDWMVKSGQTRKPYDDTKQVNALRSELIRADRKVVQALAEHHPRGFDGKVVSTETPSPPDPTPPSQIAKPSEPEHTPLPALFSMTPEELEKTHLFLRDIAKAVADKHGLTIMDMKASCRNPKVTGARQEYCYLAAKMTPKSYPQIGQAVNKDHTTVIHGIRSYGRRNGIEKLPRGLEYEGQRAS